LNAESACIMGFAELGPGIFGWSSRYPNGFGAEFKFTVRISLMTIIMIQQDFEDLGII